MRVGFCHGDPRLPFPGGSAEQPSGRWHVRGAGPVRYLADTPDGAWADFLRREEITDPADLAGIERRLWAVELPADLPLAAPVAVPRKVATGGLDSYAACQREAGRLRELGATVLMAPSAALVRGAARGQTGDGEGPAVDGIVWVLVGDQTTLRGWAAVDAGAPTERVLGLVAHYRQPSLPPEHRVDRAGRGRVDAERRSAERRTLMDLTRRERGEPERRSFRPDRRSGDDRRSG